MPFMYKNDHFTKTGSGQTQGKLRNDGPPPGNVQCVEGMTPAESQDFIEEVLTATINPGGAKNASPF